MDRGINLFTHSTMMKNYLQIAALSVLLQFGSVLPILAQQQYTLQECIDYAMEHNLSVQSMELNVQLGQVNSLQSKLELLPSINGSANYGYNWGRSINPETNFVTRQQQANGFGSLSASLNLFNGVQVYNTIKQNNANLEVSQYDLETERNIVILAVISHYTNVIFNKELLENAKSQLLSTTTQLDRTRKQVDVGALPISSLMDMQAQQAGNEVTVINAENALTLSFLQLKQAMMLPGNVELDVVIPEVELSKSDIEGLKAQEVYEIAESTMPEVKSADMQIESAVHGIAIAKGNYYPRLTLSGGINTNYSSLIADRGLVERNGVFTNVPIGFVQATNETVLSNPVEGFETLDYPLGQILSDNFGQSISLGLSIPIFNKYQANSAVQRAKITKDRADIIAEQTRQNLRQTIETAYTDVFSSGKSYQSSLKQVEAQTEAFRATKQRYDNGAANYTEFELAQNNLFRAKSDLLRAKYSFIFKLKILDFYQGKPIDF